MNEEDEELVCVNVYPHSTAVEAIAASPSDASIVLTAHTNVKACDIWGLLFFFFFFLTRQNTRDLTWIRV